MLKALALLALLLCAGCCQLSDNHAIVGLDEYGTPNSVVEVRDGLYYLWPFGQSVESATSECREFSEWGAQIAYADFRRAMGYPPGIELRAQDGTTICPDGMCK